MSGLSGAGRRREIITQQLAHDNIVRVAELSRRFGVSEVSIRRDLEHLERAGLLQRVHGGAVAVPVGSAARESAAAPAAHLDEKRRIGRAAAALVHNNDRVMFDSGTTVLEVARVLATSPPDSCKLTAITCSLPIVEELGQHRCVHMLLLGGLYLPEMRLVTGPQTVESLRSLHADILFLGADGMTLSHGVTTANVLEADVDRAMIRAADEVILVADSSKIGGIGLTTIMPLERVNKLITDTGAPPAFVNALREAGVDVVLV